MKVSSLIQIGISLITSILVLALFLYMPLSVDKIQTELMLGTTVTELSGTDIIKDFPTTYNANLNALNDNKLESSSYFSTTTHASITSLPSLDTIGTITTGAWNADTLTVEYGGTGSTTLMTNAVLLGNGTSGILGVATGSEDQVLTMKSGVPTWDSGTVNETLNYGWTGWHNFVHAGFDSATATTMTADEIILSADGNTDMEVVSKSYVDAREPLYYFETDSFDLAGGTSTKTYTHNLGYVPSYAKLTILASLNTAPNLVSNGASTRTSDGCVWLGDNDTSGNTTYLGYLEFDDTNNYVITASTTDWTTTDLDIYFTSNNSADPTIKVLVEVFN